MAQRRKKRIAVVQCSKEAGSCQWGCIGCGACVSACRLGAVGLNEYQTAKIDPEKCVGCGVCAKGCPQNLIRITTEEFTIYPACANCDLGAQTRKDCEKGCIGCGICERSCPAGAIRIEENHAVIDEERCIACGMCAVKCPKGVIHDRNGIFAAV